MKRLLLLFVFLPEFAWAGDGYTRLVHQQQQHRESAQALRRQLRQEAAAFAASLDDFYRENAAKQELRQQANSGIKARTRYRRDTAASKRPNARQHATSKTTSTHTAATLDDPFGFADEISNASLAPDVPRQSITHRNVPQASIPKTMRVWLVTAERQNQSLSSARSALTAAQGNLAKSLEEAIDQIRTEDIEGERITLPLLRKFVSQLKSEAEPMAASHQQFHSALRAYQAELKNLVPQIEKAATVFREFASEEAHDELRADYLLWADAFGSNAKKVASEAELLNNEVAKIANNLEYARATKTMLERLDAFLFVLPEDTDVRPFITQLQRYIVNFEQLRDLLRKFHSAVAEDADALSARTT